MIIFRTAHALILRPPPAVDPLIGPQINGAMTRTTTLTVIMMVELVASMKLMDGILTAQYGLFFVFYILYT